MKRLVLLVVAVPVLLFIVQNFQVAEVRFLTWRIGFEALALYYNTEEAKEGTQAFLEKRRPDFRRKRSA